MGRNPPAGPLPQKFSSPQFPWALVLLVVGTPTALSPVSLCALARALLLSFPMIPWAVLTPGFFNPFRFFFLTRLLPRPDSESGRTGCKFASAAPLTLRNDPARHRGPPTPISRACFLLCSWPWAPSPSFLLLLPRSLQIQPTHPLLQEALSDHCPLGCDGAPRFPQHSCLSAGPTRTRRAPNTGPTRAMSTL